MFIRFRTKQIEQIASRLQVGKLWFGILFVMYYNSSHKVWIMKCTFVQSSQKFKFNHSERLYYTLHQFINIQYDSTVSRFNITTCT